MIPANAWYALGAFLCALLCVVLLMRSPRRVGPWEARARRNTERRRGWRLK